MVMKLQESYDLPGWRKIKSWRRALKNKMRALGRAVYSGGKGKSKRVKKTTEEYLKKAKSLYSKLEKGKRKFPVLALRDRFILRELEYFMSFLLKHIDLLERRIIKGETIPHEEKIFSVFETYTEWISKGKKRLGVELGKRTAITTDQYHLIVDYVVIEKESDSEIVPELSKRLLSLYGKIASWSFDKGFWNRSNKELLSEQVSLLVLPKKGKCNKEEYEEEHQAIFKRYRHKHSVGESNINELEHRGLNKCPDKGYRHFKTYVGLAVSAYNLRKIGSEIIRLAREEKTNE